MIDLFSDTRTRPTAAMRRAMAEAEVGDEQAFEDPTTNRLRDRVCELLGKEDAVFMPSGTMCNEIALAVHCRPGDEVLAHETSHLLHYEAGGPAAVAGVLVTPLRGAAGQYAAAELRAAVRPAGRHFPRTRLACVEQTANLPGGRVWPIERLREVANAAREAKLATHMDGARLMNAVVASGVSAREQSAGFDSVWIDFSKGLGCPVGAMLAGTREFVEEAWRWKQRLGGAMRQSGILAAAALHALDHHVERLADDHANARLLAAGLAELPGIEIDLASVETNLVYFDVAGTGRDAPALASELLARGVRIGATAATRMRAVTHLDVGRDAVLHTLDVLRDVLREVLPAH